MKFTGKNIFGEEVTIDTITTPSCFMKMRKDKPIDIDNTRPSRFTEFTKVAMKYTPQQEAV